MKGGGDNTPEPEIDYSAPPTDIPGPFGDFLRDVRRSTPGFQSSKDAEKHKNLALEMAIAFGEADKLNKYLALHDRDLEDLKSDLLKNISIALKQAENGEVISFEDFCKEMSEEYGL